MGVMKTSAGDCCMAGPLVAKAETFVGEVLLEAGERRSSSCGDRTTGVGRCSRVCASQCMIGYKCSDAFVILRSVVVKEWSEASNVTSHRGSTLLF